MRLLFIPFICLLFGNIQAQAPNTDKVSHQKDVKSQDLNAYLLPKDHPAREPLKTLFRNAHMFDSPAKLKKAGFSVKLGHKRLMVGFHPSLPHYAIKKFEDCVPQKMQLENYLQRIEGAQVLKNYIKEHHFKHLKIPKKWLYILPKSFSKKGVNAYVLIVEKMDIYDDWDNPDGEARKMYHQMDLETATELCMILHDVGGCDAFPWNQPFTRSGKIAFVDTEHVGKRKFHDYFIRNIIPQLNPEMQAYGLALWAQLQEEERIKNL